ncbi:MAG TPA: beta-galactosidase family protein [Vicinamibacterales bacterium]
MLRPLLALLASASLLLQGHTASRLAAGSGGFTLDGKPFQIISGEMHYPRVPREYWRDRVRQARARGLNTISTYVFWNLHEAAPEQFDFTGQRNVATFIRTAGEEGLHVIVRPGPYVCAEWELGGYPAWLLADPAIVLRSTDPTFTAPAERWLARLGKELAPLLASRGGPVIAIQVENEYGSFDRDRAYMEWQRDALVKAGLDGALLYTADGGVQLPNGTLADLPAVVNFGTGEAEDAFRRLAAFRPGGPMMSGEYWAGWFDHWGVAHHTTDGVKEAAELDWMLAHGYSVNLYMFHGGTTFGFMNGANMNRTAYLPQTSSYDYDAALNESGRLTPKYFAFREVIARHTPGPLPPIPPSDAPIAIPAFDVQATLPLWEALPAPVRVERPRPMESFGQSYGYILYRITVKGPVRAALVIRDVRDYAQVYVNGTLQGTIDRRIGADRVSLDVPEGEARLDILVENTGRVKFTKALREERKGITQPVLLGDRELTGWQVFSLPMTSPPRITRTASTSGPAFYSGSFRLATIGDTYLDMRGWPKGTVWVNGHHLGRFWSIGPQQTLYVPGPWLRTGSNEIVVFSLSPPRARTLRGLAAPVFELAAVK